MFSLQHPPPPSLTPNAGSVDSPAFLLTSVLLLRSALHKSNEGCICIALSHLQYDTLPKFNVARHKSKTVDIPTPCQQTLPTNKNSKYSNSPYTPDLQDFFGVTSLTTKHRKCFKIFRHLYKRVIAQGLAY